MSILELNQVSYSYEKKGNQVLADISYSCEKGKLYAITGRSGAGKTTLLSLICGLATPTSGSILLNGKDISSLNRYDYRSHDIGVIFQSFNLLPKLTARENVILSMDIAGYPCEDKKANELFGFESTFTNIWVENRVGRYRSVNGNFGSGKCASENNR